jgi:hypothetical protein
MPAELVNKADAPIGISEGEEAFPQNLDSDLRPVGICDFRR